MFCRVMHFNNSLTSANVLMSQTAKQYKCYMGKYTTNHCYIDLVVQVIYIENSGKTRSPLGD